MKVSLHRKVFSHKYFYLDVEYEETLKPCEGDDEDLPEEADSGFRTGENFEPKLEEVNEVEQESQKTVEVTAEVKAEEKPEEIIETVKVEEDLKPMITKITINKKTEDEETVEVKEEEVVEAIPEEQKVIEQEEPEEASTEMEIVEVQSSPAVLQSLDDSESVATETTYVEEKTETEEIELESLESALEKLNEKSFEIIDSTESANSEKESEMNELEIEPMTTIEEQTEPSTLNSGTTGGTLMSRTRTESEVVREDCSDWANSPCMKLKVSSYQIITTCR